MTKIVPRNAMKPTSVTMHPNAHEELLEMCVLVRGSHQDVMRDAVQRAARNGMALHVPDWVLQRRHNSRKTRRPKMLYLRPEDSAALWKLQRQLDLNASRTMEVCLHSAWLAHHAK
jgi:hypothetical protein